MPAGVEPACGRLRSVLWECGEVAYPALVPGSSELKMTTAGGRVSRDLHFRKSGVQERGAIASLNH